MTHRSAEGRRSFDRMRCRTKVALTIAVALMLGVTGCGAAQPTSGHGVTVVSAAVPGLDPPAPPPDPPQSAPESSALSPNSPALPHDFVAPAAPTSFEMSGPAFDIKANVCQMKYVRPLNPPGDQMHTVCWVRKGFGVAPGSDSGGTSYILGHAWAKTPLIFNPLSELAMQEVTGQNPEMQSGVPIFPVKVMDGYNVVLRTPTGTLTYTVTRAFAVLKSQAGEVKSLMANTPNRVVLITCGVKNGVDVDYNIVVDAYLTSSTAT
jgi:Sortase domain